MAEYRIDKDTVWFDTDIINVHNYPPSPKTFSYITKVYRQFSAEPLSVRDVEGQPIYFDDLTAEQRTLAIIMANAQNALLNTVNFDQFLNEFKKER